MAGNKVIFDLVANTTKAASAFKKFGKDASSAMQDVEKSSGLMSKALGVATAAFAGMIAIKVIDWIADQIDEFTQYADELSKTADRLGITTEELQKMNYIAELSGVTVEEMAKGMQLLNRNMAEAADGTTTQKDAFDKLGLSARDLQQLALPEAFAQIGEAINQLTSSSEQAQVSWDIFGKSGGKFLTIFKSGTENIRAMAKELDDMGGVLDDEVIAASVEMRDQITRMEWAWRGLKASVMPLLIEWSLKLADVGKQALLFAKHPELIKRSVYEAFGEESQRSVDLYTGKIKLFREEMEKIGVTDIELDVPEVYDLRRGYLALREAINLAYRDLVPGKDLEGAKKKIKEIDDAITAAMDRMKEKAGKGETDQDPRIRALMEAAAAEQAALAAEAAAKKRQQAEDQATKAMDNATKIRISLMTDERAKAKEILDWKMANIEVEYDKKIEKYGQFLSFVDEKQQQELQATQEFNATISALNDAELEKELDRKNQLLEMERAQRDAKLEMYAEGEADYLAHQQTLEEIANTRDQAVYQRMQTQLTRTADFYNQQVEKARMAGATEEQIEQIKYNMKKDLGVAALKDAQQLALAYAAESKNAWRVYKATAIAQALVDTYQGTIAAFKAMAGIFPAPLWGILAGGAALAWGLTRVQKIRQQERPTAAEGGVFSGPTSGYPATLHGTEAVVPLPGGRAIPVEGAGGGGNLQVNITATDSQSFTDLVARNPQAIIGPLVEQLQLGNRNLISTMQNTTREE